LSLLLLVGSAREESNTAKIAGVLRAALAARGARVDLVDPRQIDLRVPGSAGSEAAASKLMADLQARARAAAGVACVTPEYDGSYSAVTKLLFEHLGYPSVLAGKPLAIVGVAAGQMGATRAVDHVRAMGVHVGALVVPDAASIAMVHKAFDPRGQLVDQGVGAQLDRVAEALVALARRLSSG
jgi:NAD(P)H-dependent FMN reductase